MRAWPAVLWLLGACGGPRFGQSGVAPFTSAEAAELRDCRYAWDDRGGEDWWDCEVMDIKHAPVASYSGHRQALELPARLHRADGAKLQRAKPTSVAANGHQLTMSALRWSDKKGEPYEVQFVLTRPGHGAGGHVYWCSLHPKLAPGGDLTTWGRRCVAAVKAIDRVYAVE